MEQTIYLFLGENLKIKTDNLQLFDKYLLSKPNKSELSFLEHFLEKNIGILTSNNPFIKRFKETKEYNLWVIKHPYSKSHEIVKNVLALSSLNLSILLEWFCIADANYLSIDDLTTKIIYNELEKDKFPEVILDDAAIYELRFIWNLFMENKKNIDSSTRLKKVIKDFMDLKEIHKGTSFKFLGYFSILENILTHNKGRSASNSSITFQLQNKLNLINNRFDAPMDFKKYFKLPDTVTFSTLIEKLYQYRSDIAHGSESDFNKELSILKNNKNNSLKFIHELTRNVILQYIKEPTLVENLKHC